VWKVHLRSLRIFLEALWRKEVAVPAAPGFVPSELELAFDGRVEGTDGEDAVLLGGRVDRVDLARDDDGLRAALFDYKSGTLGRFKSELKEAAFADTSWQLPIYAAAVRAQLGAGDVRMHYYSLRHLEVRGADAPPWLSFARGDDPDAPTLGDHVARHVRAMREGRFEVAPRTDACAVCGMQAACRVVERRDDEDEGER
jgi:ATP-dependent helicase/DNAse subunit B